MTREWIEMPEGHTVERAIGDLRARGELPPQTDRVFVVDARHVLRRHRAAAGAAGARRHRRWSSAAMTRRHRPPSDRTTDASGAVKAFERYDLVSAPVVDDRGKLIGRLTVDAVMDVTAPAADLQALRTAGLREDEDLFAAPLASARNRWPWLGINLVTAFIASRVIGQFEGDHRAAVGARRADADRGQHRRQHRQPDDGARDPGAGRRPDADRRRAARLLRKELVDQPAERHRVGPDRRPVRA